MRLLKVALGAATAVALIAGATPAGAAVDNLTYHGGAIEPTPAVYLVYWGQQWATLGDPAGEAAYERAFLNSIYTGGDSWITSTQQYCSGAPVGATSCGPGTTHVGSPSGPLVKGIWYDTASVAVPVQPEFAAEALRAATHFGNTTAASNASVEYVIHTATHSNDPEAGLVYCAYHSSTSSPTAGQVAYTSMPYVPDYQTTCGGNAVNSGTRGTLDGVSIVGGHEFAEVITDPFPDGGWLDSAGLENADKCAWVTSGPGAMHDIGVGGSQYAVQTLWSNAAGACV
jgi:serine protease